MSGNSGDPGGDGGESAGGGGGATLCTDLCTPDAPACCTTALVEPPPAARFEFDLTPEASLAYSAMLTGYSLMNHPFRVSCDDEPLFVGLIYKKDWAAAIQAPVMDAEATADDALVLELGAWEGAWTQSEPFGGDDTLRERIDRPELRATFCARGILREFE